MDLEVTAIKNTLAKGIHEFRSKDIEKYSYNFIGSKTGLSPSFIERASKNKLGEKLDASKILPLSELVCSYEDQKKIASHFAKQILSEDSSILKDAIYTKFVIQNNRAFSVDVEKFLEVEETYIPYLLSANQFGTTEKKVREVLGEIGVHGLKTLEQKGLIKKIEDTFYSLKKDFSNTFETLKKQIPILARLYRPSHVGKNRNYIHIITESLTPEGIKEWQIAHREHYERLNAIKDKYKGKNDAFSVAFMDTFSSEDLK